MIVSPVPTKRLDLGSMSPEFMKALLSGQRAEAEATAGLDLPPDWPDNDPSLAMAVKLGIRQIGEQMDDEDG